MKNFLKKHKNTPNYSKEFPFFAIIWLLRAIFLPITAFLFLQNSILCFLRFAGILEKKPPIGIITTGGTGGHVLPALRQCCYVAKKGENICFYTNKLSIPFMQKIGNVYIEEGYQLFQQNESFLDSNTPIAIKTHNLRLLKKNLKSGINFIASLVNAFVFFFTYRQKVSFIFGFGGYASFPLMFFGTLFFQKIYIHEQNTTFGKVNRLFIPFTKKCFTTFFQSQLKNSLFTGMPLIKENEIREYIRKKDEEVVNILVMSGSYGGTEASTTILPALVLLSRHKKIKVHYQASGEIAQHIHKTFEKHNIKHKIQPFFENIYNLLPQINIAISRPGACSIVDLLIFGIPTVFVPLQHSAENHQLKNAIWVANNELGYLFKPWESNSYNLATLLAIAFSHKKTAKQQISIKRNARALIFQNLYNTKPKLTKKH